MASALAGTTPDDRLGAWLADGADPVPVDTLLAYAPADVADAERYCLALYHQLDVIEGRRPSDAVEALWARTSQLDPERRLLKAAYDLSLLDVCYETLRESNLFGRWLRPRPRLADLIGSSRSLRAYYDDAERRARATTFPSPIQLVKDLVRNLLMMLFLIVAIGTPAGLLSGRLMSWPVLNGAVVQAALIGVLTSVAVVVLRPVLGLPRSPSILVLDHRTAQVLRSGPVAFLARSILYDLFDEVVRRWMGVFSYAFLLSLIELALMYYVGSLVLIVAAVAVASERCSLSTIVAISGLAAIATVAQLSNTSLLWSLGHGLNSLSSWLLQPFHSVDPSTYFPSRPDLLTAVALSQIRLPTGMTLKPWRFADLFSELSNMVVSSFFWNVALSEGLFTALLARLVFSAVSGFLLYAVQGPIAAESVSKLHEE